MKFLSTIIFLTLISFTAMAYEPIEYHTPTVGDYVKYKFVALHSDKSLKSLGTMSLEIASFDSVNEQYDIKIDVSIDKVGEKHHDEVKHAVYRADLVNESYKAVFDASGSELGCQARQGTIMKLETLAGAFSVCKATDSKSTVVIEAWFAPIPALLGGAAQAIATTTPAGELGYFFLESYGFKDFSAPITLQ